MQNQPTDSKTTHRPKTCRVSLTFDEKTITLLDAWHTQIDWTPTRTRAVAALVGIALGDVRWGKNSPGFGAAWTPTPGYESVADNRPQDDLANESAAEVESMLPCRTTPTGQVLRLVPSISVRI